MNILLKSILIGSVTVAYIIVTILAIVDVPTIGAFMALAPIASFIAWFLLDV